MSSPQTGREPMNLTINQAFLKSKLRRAKQLQTIGLLLVIFSFVLSIVMTGNYLLVLLAYPALLVGFPLWQFGRGHVRAWKAAAELPKAVLEEVRPGPKQQIYAYAPVAGTVIDYLLTGTEGLIAIELKGLTEDDKGRFAVACKRVAGQDRWTQRLPVLERLARLGEPRLGNPSADLTAKTAALRTWLDAQGCPATRVWGVVAFRQDATPLDIEESAVEVLHLGDLRAFLAFGQYFDEPMRTAPAPPDERNRVNAALQALMGPAAVVAKPAAPVAPVRKLSPEARAEQERVREIRAARAAGATKPAAPGPGAARPKSPPPSTQVIAPRPPPRNGTGRPGRSA